MKSIRFNITDQAYRDFSRFRLELNELNDIDLTQQECLIYILSSLPEPSKSKPDPALVDGMERLDGSEARKSLTEDQRRNLKLYALGLLEPGEKDKKWVSKIRGK